MDYSALLAKSGRMYRDNVVVTFEGRPQTYAELVDRARRLVREQNWVSHD